MSRSAIQNGIGERLLLLVLRVLAGLLGFLRVILH